VSASPPFALNVADDDIPYAESWLSEGGSARHSVDG
jgi:hypothetical protein